MIPYLKVAVIVMGVLIVAGIVVIAIKLSQKAEELAEQDGGAEAPVSVQMSDLGLPRGAQVQSMITEEDRLVVVVRTPQEGARIVIIDLKHGGVISNIALEAGG